MRTPCQGPDNATWLCVLASSTLMIQHCKHSPLFSNGFKSSIGVEISISCWFRFASDQSHIWKKTNYAHFLPDSSAEYWIQNVNLLNCSQGCVGTINKFRKFSATFCHFHSSQVNNTRFSWKFKNLKKATKNRSYLDRASGVNMMDFLCEGDRCLLRVERKTFGWRMNSWAHRGGNRWRVKLFF